jgi:predicted dehydrogenase
MNVDPANTRNIRKYGGGALFDIGCYPIKTSRMVFGEEPVRVSATLVRDRAFDTDILTSAVLEYPSGHCVFSVSTQTFGNQSMKFFGTPGRIEVPIPFNPPSMETSRIRVNDEAEEFAPCDQYTIQGDAFSHAIRNGGVPPVPLEDSLRNMMVIDAVFRSAESGKWETVEA